MKHGRFSYDKRHMRGASVIGYALLVGLIGVVALTAISGTGDSVNELFTDVTTKIEDEVPDIGDPCSLPGAPRISSGTSITAYLEQTVPYGETCTGETRTCNNGVLTGSYPYGSCSPDSPPGSFAFSSCGQTHRYGPAQGDCDSAYASTSLDAVVTVDGTGIQSFTLPATGTWRITAVGAEGGDGQTSAVLGGRGASVTAEFSLSAGDVVRIAVGQMGQDGGDAGGGGGGGSYVALADNTPLIVAGGGGGGAHLDAGLHADPTVLADISDNGGAQGTNPLFGGAGFTAGPPSGNAQPFLNGATGASGNDGVNQSQGGFGGGGWGTNDVDGIGEDRGGGGGGYRGGDGRFLTSGGGGLSFVHPMLGTLTASQAGVGGGNGSVILTFIP